MLLQGDREMETTLRWAVRINDWHPGTAEWEFLMKLLPPQDQKQVTQFRFQDDRKRALLSQLLQRKCITTALGVHWSHVEIRRTKGKKPWVVCDDVEKDHAPNFNFNVSHESARDGMGWTIEQGHLFMAGLHDAIKSNVSAEGGVAATTAKRLSQGDFVALASEPLCICGVDVAAPQQFRGQRKVPIDSLLSSFESQFTANEMTAISEAGDTDAAKEDKFRQFWSLKEALVKARGDGLGFDFNRADFAISQGKAGWTASVAIDGIPRPRWRFFMQELSGGHWLSVSRGPPEDIVDAWGDFTDSLAARRLSDAQMQAALCAYNPPFSVLQPADLVPENRLAQYEEAVNKSIQS